MTTSFIYHAEWAPGLVAPQIMYMSFGDELRLVDADSSQQHRKRMYLAAKVSTATLLLVVVLLAIILLVDSNCCCTAGGGLLLPQCSCCNGGGGLNLPGCNCGPLGLPGGGCSSCCCNCQQSCPVNLNPIACICPQQNQCPPGLQFPNTQPNPQPNPQPAPMPMTTTSPPVMIVSACEPCCNPCGGGGGCCGGAGGCCGGGGGCAGGGGGGICVPACAPAGGCCAPAGGSICIQGGGGCCVPACNPCAGGCAGICNPGCQCACCNNCCGPTPLAGGAKLHCCSQPCERKFYLFIPMKVRQCLMPDTNCYNNVIKNACSCNNQCPPGLQVPNGNGAANGGSVNGGSANGGANGGKNNGGLNNGNKTTNGGRRRIVYDYIDIDELDEEDLPNPKKKKKKSKTKKPDVTENVKRLRRQTLARFDFLATGVLNKTVANEFGERVRFKYAQVRNQFTHAIFSNKDKTPHGYNHTTPLPPTLAMPTTTTTTHQTVTTRKWKPIFANAAPLVTTPVMTTASNSTTTTMVTSTTTTSRTTTTAEESLEVTTNITPPPVVRSPGHISFGIATVVATEKPVLIHAPVKGIETPDTAQNIHQSLNPLYDKRKDLSEEVGDGQKTGKAVKRRIGRWKRRHGETMQKSLEATTS